MREGGHACSWHELTSSFAMVAGILQGVKKGMLARAGASIRMQPGCLALLKQATQAGIPT